MPPTVEKDWDFYGEHPVIARLCADGERVWSLFRGGDLVASYYRTLYVSVSSSHR